VLGFGIIVLLLLWFTWFAICAGAATVQMQRGGRTEAAEAPDRPIPFTRWQVTGSILLVGFVLPLGVPALSVAAFSQ